MPSQFDTTEELMAAGYDMGVRPGYKYQTIDKATGEKGYKACEEVNNNGEDDYWLITTAVDGVVYSSTGGFSTNIKPY